MNNSQHGTTVKRQISLDTETTGLDPKSGHRVIEIAAIEIIDRQITKNSVRYYLNPQRKVDKGALAIHNLSDEFLADKPLFAAVVDEFIDFISGAELIIFNAPFDVGFLDHELKLLPSKYKRLHNYVSVFDALALARKLHPGKKNNLNALCKRYGISTAHRKHHGALLDAELLARVYLSMTSGQTTMFHSSNQANTSITTPPTLEIAIHNLNLVVNKANPKELITHQEYMQFLAKKSD